MTTPRLLCLHRLALLLATLGLTASPLAAEPYATTYASPELVSAVSQHVHGSTTYDLPLNVIGSPTIESRVGHVPGEFTFVATFNHPLISSTLTLVANAKAKITGKSTSGTRIRVNVAGVTDNQVIEFLFTKVTSFDTPEYGSGGFRVRILHGDVNGNGVVDESDVKAIAAQVGNDLTQDNAQYDVNWDGKIDSSDVHDESILARHFEQVPALTPEQEAARFLNQATFGATPDDIKDVVKMGEAAWINDQFKKKPISLDRLLRQGAFHYNKKNVNGISEYRGQAWWESVMTGDDPLRERVAFALSEIFVISDTDANVDYWSAGTADYYDTLTRDAFSNYLTLMTDVTFHPMMGFYLTYLHNTKGDPTTGSHPDENYARELMQLFTIGLYQLNLNGSPILDGSGQPIPTYGNTEVTNFARVFTGFSQGGKRIGFYQQHNNYEEPMSLWDDYHDRDRKTLLTYPGRKPTLLAARGTAAADIHAALHNIFNHPNVGPFVSRRLIQRLVTSNPSEAYITRIATVFNDDGKGERGNLAAVVKAILLDPEARNIGVMYDPEHGKLRESWVRTVHVARSFGAHPTLTTQTRPFLRWQLWNLNQYVGMEELRSPSVFNFFTPDYQPPGPVLDDGLTGPEFQITNAATITSTINYFRDIADYGMEPYSDKIPLRLLPQENLSGKPLEMIDNMDLLLTGGTLSSNTRASVLNAVEQIPVSKEQGNIRARAALVIIMNSPDYAIQK